MKFINTIILCFLLLSGCALTTTHRLDVKPLTEREVVFEKAKALVLAREFSKAEGLFLNLTATSEENKDSIYAISLWNLSLISEKNNEPEKAILILHQLNNSHLNTVSRFKIHASLMKNYFRVSNSTEALKYKKILDDENQKDKFAVADLYRDLVETLDLNFDRSVIAELDYVNEIQKYLLYIMEQNEFLKNEKTTDLLISIYETSYALLLNEKLNHDFKEKIAIAMLNNMRHFELLKLNDLNVNLKTVSKFSNFADTKQKQITDWLHQ
ncbi:MAG: hypothetical protein WA160_06600 [Pseudobdellovibrio sp.]